MAGTKEIQTRMKSIQDTMKITNGDLRKNSVYTNGDLRYNTYKNDCL